jgi:hypothetical protein
MGGKVPLAPVKHACAAIDLIAILVGVNASH